MTTDTGHFELSQTFPVSPDQLWHLVTDAQMREAWNAPGEGMTLVTDRADLQVGGHERHRYGPAEAPEFTVDTRWYRIEGPNDAVFTETVHADGASIATTLVTYHISTEENGARLDVAVAVSSFTGPDAGQEFEAGWAAGLTNLEALAQEFAS